MSATGAQPTGTSDEQSSAAAVRQMFDSIAPRYDLLNHVLSCNIDHLWRSRAARRFQNILPRPDASVLDICCGTGDMTLALLRRRPQGAKPILAADFSHAMLALAARDVALFFEDAGNLEFQFGGGNIHLLVPGVNRIANSCVSISATGSVNLMRSFSSIAR